MAKHKGRFPNKCPNCKSNDLEFEDYNFNSKTNLLSQEIRCNKCDEEYLEFFKAVGWED